jgi:hypothetical protein
MNKRKLINTNFKRFFLKKKLKLYIYIYIYITQILKKKKKHFFLNTIFREDMRRGDVRHPPPPHLPKSHELN